MTEGPLFWIAVCVAIATSAGCIMLFDLARRYRWMARRYGARIEILEARFGVAAKAAGGSGAARRAAVLAQAEAEKERAVAQAEEALRLAHTDPLTELPNRRRIMFELEKGLQEARQHGLRFGLLLCDIDHFKQLNDRYGHLVGDAVLKHAARLLERTIGIKGEAGRIGGEEFLVCLPDCDAQTLCATAEKVRHAIETADEDKQLPSITVSIGSALSFPEDDAATLFGRADTALYDAKNAGRNRVGLAA